MSMPKNPFPGMNPYLQECWSDVHLKLIAYVSDAVSGELPGDLLIRAEEHVLLESEDASQARRPDVAIVESWRNGFPPLWQPEEGDGGGIAVAEPLVVQESPETERWIEIRDRHGELITVIEILSPWNKREDGWLAYRGKQEEHIAARVNLVEIDLIRGGFHVTAVSLGQITFPPGTCHHVCVTRSRYDPYRREIYFCPLRQPLPAIRVPLRLSDKDVPLALQPLVDRCYQTGRYWLGDYAREPRPSVAEEDRAWVEERLRAAGLGSR